MASPKTSQISFRDISGATATNLHDKLTAIRAISSPPDPGRTVVVSGADFALLDSSIVSGNVAISGGNSEGVICTQVAGAVGSNYTTAASDNYGNLLSQISVVNHATGKVFTQSNTRVFGVLQCASTVTDGDAIGAAASENIQVSFIYEDAAGALQPATLTGTVRLGLVQGFIEANAPSHVTTAAPQAPSSFGQEVDAQPISKTFVAAEALSSGDYVNVDLGTARKANATASIPANGYVLEATSLGASVTVYFSGTNNQHAALSTGPVWLAATGLPTSTVPASGTGGIRQHLGNAISATEVNFAPDTPVALL